MSIFEKVRIKVVINASGAPNSFKIKQTDGTVKYSGLFFDIYHQIKETLSDRYSFEETYIDKDWSVGDTLDSIKDGKYDIAISNFTTTTKRLKDVNFTRPIIMEKDVIVYKESGVETLNIMWRLLTDVLLLPLILVVAIGFMLGTLLYYVQPSRKKHLDPKMKNKSFKKSIMTSISTFLGEAGMMAEESPLGWGAMLLTFLIMAIALALNNFITATATNRVLELNESAKYTKENLPNMKLLGQKGQNIITNFRRYGADVEEFEGNVKKMIAKYMENTDKYNGVVLETSVAMVVTKKYNMSMTGTNFGFGEAVFPVNKDRPELLRLFNTEIKKLQESLETEKICKKYMNPSKTYLCVL